MKSIRFSGIFFLLLVFVALAMVGFKQENKGAMLYEKYFDPTPTSGYGVQRALEAAGTDLDQSILRQGITYHQQGEYDLALVSLRAYLESNPVPEDYQPLLLAATAAMATGEYLEAEHYLGDMPTDNPEAEADQSWYLAMLDLHHNNLAPAVGAVRSLELQQPVNAYPAAELMADL